MDLKVWNVAYTYLLKLRLLPRCHFESFKSCHSGRVLQFVNLQSFKVSNVFGSVKVSRFKSIWNFQNFKLLETYIVSKLQRWSFSFENQWMTTLKLLKCMLWNVDTFQLETLEVSNLKLWKFKLETLCFSVLKLSKFQIRVVRGEGGIERTPRV